MWPGEPRAAIPPPVVRTVAGEATTGQPVTSEKMILATQHQQMFQAASGSTRILYHQYESHLETEVSHVLAIFQRGMRALPADVREHVTEKQWAEDKRAAEAINRYFETRQNPYDMPLTIRPEMDAAGNPMYRVSVANQPPAYLYGEHLQNGIEGYVAHFREARFQYGKAQLSLVHKRGHFLLDFYGVWTIDAAMSNVRPELDDEQMARNEMLTANALGIRERDEAPSPPMPEEHETPVDPGWDDGAYPEGP